MEHLSSTNKLLNTQLKSHSHRSVSSAFPFFKPFIQPKLTINQPGDEYEQEADAVADRVMRIEQTLSPQSFFKPSPIQRKCASCEEDEKKTQLKESSTVIQRQEPAAPLPQAPDLTLHLPDLSQPSAAPNFLSMRQPFINRNIFHLWDPNSALQIWQYNFDFFHRFGLSPDTSASLSNLTAPMFIDSQLKAGNPTWWEITDRELNTSTIGASIPLLEFNPNFSPVMPSWLKFFGGGGSGAQRKSAKNEAQLKESDAAPSTENYLTTLSQGRSLNENQRNFFESKMGYDFSDVRLHDNSKANESAKNINALAYTHGNDIVFGADQYQPETDDGKRLMAHELTHVVQQNAGIKRLVIQRDVGWAARGTPYGPPLTSERTASVSETISNAPAGKEAWNGSFTWTSRFGLSYDLNTGIATVVMRLFSSATPDVKTQWKTAIESKWSNRFKIDTLKDDKSVLRSNPILVNIQWVDDAANAHYSINPQSPGATSGGRAGIGGTSSMKDWGTADTTDISHEFGHMLGNTEEYFTTNGVDYTAGGAKKGFRDPGGGIMNNPSENPEARHYESVKVEYAKMNALSLSLVRVTAI